MKITHYLTALVISSIVIVGSCLSFVQGVYVAKDRSLPGIRIIKRTDWINDESIIYKKPTTTGTTQDNDDTSSPVSLSKAQIANNYLRTVFPEQFVLDGIINMVNNDRLLRSRGYLKRKTHIVVHHTVSDLEKIKTPLDALTVINDIFKYHAQTRDWGDIGYNFIIDPWGNIYEGRGGGADVMGAHAAYNNSPSIGISLLGNFEISEPTTKQLIALKKLSKALMIKYQINPDNQIYGHKASDTNPYIQDLVLGVFIGHRDVGNTACPGKNLYNKLPSVLSDITKELKNAKITIPTTKLRYRYYYQTGFFASDDTFSLTIPYPLNGSIASCKILQSGIRAGKCSYKDGILQTILKKEKNTKSLENLMLDFTTTKGELYRIVFTVERASDYQAKLQERRLHYHTTHTALTAPKSSTKITQSIDLDTISDLIKKSVSVLLYELSTTKKERKILCQNCIVTDNQGTVYHDKSFLISESKGSLSYTSKTQTTTTLSSFTIQNEKSDSRIYITNYERKSYAGIARNNFYGTLTISRQPITLIGADKPSKQFVLINTLPFDLYMRGLVESDDTQPVEKIKTTALISKNYITYYLTTGNRHPNVPNGANYQAIDDARIFQKYVGAGIDSTLKNWKPALESTKNQFVMYQGSLALLPYFSCSAGFTRSAAEKYGRTDTPYLQSVTDIDYCKEFEGHGVGLAGKGATALAKKGLQASDIINYYYSGVVLEIIE